MSEIIAAASDKVVKFGVMQGSAKVALRHQRVEPETLESGRKAVIAL